MRATVIEAQVWLARDFRAAKALRSFQLFAIAPSLPASPSPHPFSPAQSRGSEAMSDTKYLLVSLPTSISPSNDKDEALTALRSTISTDNGSVLPFKIPDFKIGTLDALVQQADDLAKLEASCEGVVAKVGDSLRTLLEGDEEKISQQKTVNDKPADQYLRTFTWNKVKYRADKPLVELIDSLQKELISIDNDVKSKVTQYNQVKTNLTTLQRKQTGNLATKSLTPVVDPKILIQDSEYLETHLVAVPTVLKKDFLKSYETISPMVVPRSSVEVAQDDEFTLFAVTTFKKHSTDFQHKCRENKWTPRDYKYVQGGKEEERKEVERVGKDERKVWGEALRLSRTGWSESVMIWIHVLTLRVFVETVLRYGLPLEYVCGLVKTNPKSAKKAKASLDSAYSYLGGNAFGRDKKGKVTKDDSALSSEMAAAGVGGHSGEGSEYTAYVYYEFQII
ncbi:V-ATPase subunit C [Phlyctema vagabunda]|uniref:V-type proton ATPase subunit C n=1 Tax=Phlyctema vagabunda TaxID=108571 RepID=A0ABR4PBM4_9HELO